MSRIVCSCRRCCRRRPNIPEDAPFNVYRGYLPAEMELTEPLLKIITHWQRTHAETAQRSSSTTPQSSDSSALLLTSALPQCACTSCSTSGMSSTAWM